MILQEKSTKSALYYAIKEKKAEMFTLGQEYGLGDVRTVQCSQELDDLLNQHLLHSILLKKEIPITT